MNLDNLKEASVEAKGKSKKGFPVEGFSMLWNQETAFQISRLFGTHYQQMNSILSWDDTKLNEAVNYLRDWSKEVNGGLSQEKEFIEKFLYDPKTKLIANNRIYFSYSTLHGFFAIPTEKRETLDFRWLSIKNNVNVLHSILYTGIPKSAKNKKGAKTFLTWFFRLDVQGKLLEATLHKRIRSFGIGQGFSSLQTINTRELPRLYPALMGHIPPESALVFPPKVPENWITIKDQIVKPWLYSNIISPEKPAESLKDAMMDWQKQNPAQKLILD